jgi:hypothetical protein
MNRVQLVDDFRYRRQQTKSISDLKNFVHFCLCGKYYKMERTQDKQVINITEPLMNRINELIATTR